MIEVKKLSIEQLILVSIASVQGKKERCSFGRLVKESFSLFPEVFSLSEYPMWPDSLKLDRPIRKLRQMGFITGSPLTYFSLTKFGQGAARSLEIKMKRQEEKKKLFINKLYTRSPDLALLKEISESEEFRKFLEDKKDYKPNNMRIREITKFTLEAPIEAVIESLDYLYQIAKKRKEKDLSEFLMRCKNFLRSK